MQYVLLGTLGVVTIIHIIGLLLGSFKIKAITKPLLVPLILGYYLIAAKQINWLIFAALAFGWLGDIFLLNKTHKFLTIGAFLFFIEQVLLITSFSLLIDYSKVSIGFLVGAPILYIGCSFLYHFVFIRKYQQHGSTFWLSLIYLSTNALTSTFALFYMLSNACLATAILYAGTTLFFVSDAVLIYGKLTKKTNLDPKGVFIMISYILAQLAIVLAFIL